MKRIFVFAAVFAGIIFSGMYFWMTREESKIHIEQIGRGADNSGATKSEAERKEDNVAIPEPKSVSQDDSSQEEIVEQKAASMHDKQSVDTKGVEDSVLQSEKKLKPEDDTPKTAKNNGMSIQSRLVSWGFKKSEKRTVSAIILHSTYNALGGDKYGVKEILDIYKSYGVSPHYLIDREGVVYRLVEENNIAYHAGVAKLPDGKTDVNGLSIGIELIGDMESGFSQSQYTSVNALIRDIQSRYAIRYILGHNEVAPGRKTDPWKIDWKKIDR